MTLSRFTTGDGCALAYRIDGPADAPVLVLSNSLGTAMEMWSPQIEALAARYRVLRYDSRGHGRSDVPPGAYSMDRLGRDVIELMDGLGIDRARFCGLSKGGMVGQWLGYRAPERIERLVLCNTSPFMGPPSAWDDRIAAVRAGGMAAMTDAVIARWFTPGFAERMPEAVLPVRAMLLATDPAGYAGCCAAIRDMDMRPILGLIKVPVTIVGGDLDPATPAEHSHALRDGIPGARLVMLPTAHLSNVERPADFLAATGL